MEFEEERTDDIVQAGAQAAAGHDAGTRLLCIEEQLRARPGQFEAQPCSGRRLRVAHDLFGDAEGVADGAPDGGGEASFSQDGDIHDSVLIKVRSLRTS
jgi:hypothetical protein